ncbi:MAG: hypothetical protein COA78_08950 [Blastopirellula sp.]|nr:MAG: hypothetical protein COA78_08950 [Blastopirellula sp.]
MKKLLLRIPVALRIAYGLTCSMSCIFLAASLMGLFPDMQAEQIRNRDRFCMLTAESYVSLINELDSQQMQAHLEGIARSNSDILSIGIRKNDGHLMFQVHDHAKNWSIDQDGKLAESNFSIPLDAGGKRWATIEVAFVPQSDFVRYCNLLGPGIIPSLAISFPCFIVFYFYLSSIFTPFKPSNSIPHRVREALDCLSEGLIIIDLKQRIMLANQAFKELTSKDDDEILGLVIEEFQFSANSEQADESFPWIHTQDTGESVSGRLLSYQSSDEKEYTFSVSANVIKDDNGIVQGVIVSFENVTELENKKQQFSSMVNELEDTNKELEYLATRDSLTGCLNRRSYFEKFEKLLKEAQQENLAISVMMVDIDFFKSINDNYGHSMGDIVLEKVGATLQEAALISGLACRYGGEEFALLMPDASIDEAVQVAEKIRQAIEDLTFPDFSITTSIGVSQRTPETKSPEDLLDQADKCLYVAKRNGRNQVVRFDEVPDETVIDESKICRTKEEEESRK